MKTKGKERLLSTGRIGIVIPTLGTRPDTLNESINSARTAGADFIVLVSKSEDFVASLLSSGLVDDFCLDRDRGLSTAIADGIEHLPDDVTYVNWLGDDDLLEPDSLLLLRSVLESELLNRPYAFGRCSYIDEVGNHLFVMPTGSWARTLMRLGPQLVAQPACLIRRNALQEVGGLDESLSWAFDLDLLLKLECLTQSVFVNQKIARFRWHSGSKSVDSRKQSVREAELVRRKHMGGVSRLVLFLNPVISLIILMCGNLLSRFVARHKSSVMR